MNPAAAGAKIRSWWQRGVRDPLVAQLTQGATPDRLALALGVGGVLAVNPFLGTTTAACLIAGVLLRLNQPVLQLANVLAAPLQIALLLPWVRTGEWLWSAPPMPFSPSTIVAEFSAGPVDFLRRFAWTGVHAATAWAAAAPLLGFVVFRISRPLLVRLRPVAEPTPRAPRPRQ